MGECQGNRRTTETKDTTETLTTEQVLADMFREDLGVTIDPMALRMFVRHRFTRLSPLAHRIHDGKR